MPKICLDPGHNASGADTGAEGYGLREQELTLDVARRLWPLLEYNGFGVVMTREGDYVNGPHGTVNESLQTRCDIANAAGVALFVSIHINAGGGTGAEVYIAAAGGQAEVAAHKVLPYLVQAGNWMNRGVKTENLYVLRNTSMPAILTESGFIDTESDAGKLANPDLRQAIAVAHAKGLCDYFGVQYKEQGGYEVEKAVLVFGQPDVEVAKRLMGQIGNCPIMFRDANGNPPAEISAAKQLFVVGGKTDGSDVNHPNKVTLAGQTWFDTVVAVGKYLGQLK